MNSISKTEFGFLESFWRAVRKYLRVFRDVFVCRPSVVMWSAGNEPRSYREEIFGNEHVMIQLLLLKGRLQKKTCLFTKFFACRNHFLQKWGGDI